MNGKQQVATLNILYAEHPNGDNGRFLEIRKWETPGGDHCELIVESGLENESGELETQCQVVPFYLSVAQVLQGMNQ